MLFFVSALVLVMVYVGKSSLSKQEKQVAVGDHEKLLKVIRASDFSIEDSQVKDTLFIDPVNLE